MVKVGGHWDQNTPVMGPHQHPALDLSLGRGPLPSPSADTPGAAPPKNTQRGGGLSRVPPPSLSPGSPHHPQPHTRAGTCHLQPLGSARQSLGGAGEHPDTQHGPPRDGTSRRAPLSPRTGRRELQVLGRGTGNTGNTGNTGREKGAGGQGGRTWPQEWGHHGGHRRGRPALSQRGGDSVLSPGGCWAGWGGGDEPRPGVAMAGGGGGSRRMGRVPLRPATPSIVNADEAGGAQGHSGTDRAVPWPWSLPNPPPPPLHPMAELHQSLPQERGSGPPQPCWSPGSTRHPAAEGLWGGGGSQPLVVTQWCPRAHWGRARSRPPPRRAVLPAGSPASESIPGLGCP